MTPILEVYGEKFQMAVIRVIMRDASFYRTIREFLDPKYFTIEYAKMPYVLINEHFDQYHVVPTFDVLEARIKSTLYHRQIEMDIVLKELHRINYESIKDDTFIKDEVINFCKMQEAEALFYKQKTLMERAKSDLTVKPNFEKIYEGWKKVLGLSIDGIDSDSIKDMRQMYQIESERYAVSTGYEMLDYILDGGMGDGEVHTIAAYSGRGKTTLAINVAANIYKAGGNVLFFTFENSSKYINKALHSRISNVPIRNVPSQLDYVEAELNKYKGGLHVKQYAMKRHTTKIIESYYTQLVDSGYTPDLIIIDSPLHLKPTSDKKSDWESVGVIWKDVKGLMQELHKPALVTAQLGKQAAQLDEADTENTGNSISIAQDSDSWISINRTKEQMTAGRGNFFIGKNRFGPDGFSWPMFWRGSTRLIEEDHSIVALKLDEIRKTVEFSYQEEAKKDVPDPTIKPKVNTINTVEW